MDEDLGNLSIPIRPVSQFGQQRLDFDYFFVAIMGMCD
jgi:hypothetical protein